MQQRDKEMKSIKMSLRVLEDRNIPQSPNGHLKKKNWKNKKGKKILKYIIADNFQKLFRDKSLISRNSINFKQENHKKLTSIYSSKDIDCQRQRDDIESS